MHHHLLLIVFVSSAAAVFLPGAIGQEISVVHRPKRKIESIPADDSLLRPEVSEAVELRLAHVGIGSQNIIGRRRRGPVSNLPSRQDDDDDNVVEYHKRTIIKSQDHGESKHDEADTIDENDHNDSSGPEENTAKLLHELTGLRENIEKEIARLKQYQSEQKVQSSSSNTNILARASRELVRRAELDSRKKRHQNSQEAEILLPYRACIYLDLPGVDKKDEGEPLLPETLQMTGQKQGSFGTQSQDDDDKAIRKQIIQSVKEIEEETREETTNIESKPQNIPPPHHHTDSKDATVEDVLWLHIPPNDPIDNVEEMKTTLYNAVDNLHHEGKDVLFIPISKNYSDTEDVRHGFLKSLEINPDRYKKFKSLRIK